jgi:predicted component of type VI protein secretion system
LQQLVRDVETGDHLKIWVMNLPKPALAQSLLAHQGTRREDLPLFKKLFGESYGSFGGEPFGAIVADYGFDHRPADAALLAELAGLAAACHTVFILGPEPGGAQRGVWRALCEADAARHLLMAPPGPGEAAVPNPAFALACEIGNDFAAQGWSTRAHGLLAANKLVQALMCKLRDVRAGEHANLAALSEALNAWLQTYVDARAHPADSAQGALRPLAQARVALQALDPGSGQFRMQVTVTPRHQFEGPLPRISVRTQALSWPG